MKTIICVGDSITDCARDYSNDANLGMGYAQRVAGILGYENPGEYLVYNRGINGNRIVDVYARMKADIVNLKPDYVSILIGVNDVWHDYNANKNGVSADKFLKVYDMLIEELKQELPETKIMILEPFLTHGNVIDPLWDTFFPEVRLRAKMAKKVADKYALTFVTLQDKFDDAMGKFNKCDNWTREGVHPTPAGQELITRAWFEGFEILNNA